MSEIIYEKIGRIGKIVLNRPEVRNAFNMAMIDKWHTALETAKFDSDIRVIVVTGEGKAFCAGGDLNEIERNSNDTSIERKEFLWKGVHKVAFSLLDLDKPVIAAVNGAAFGAGLDMAMHCDIRLVAASAKLSESYVKVGLVPGNGGTYWLPRLVGMAKAAEMFFTGCIIDATEAKRIGLVNEVYPDEELMSKAMEMAETIADGPPIQMAMIKRQLRQAMNSSLKDHLDFASSNMSIAMDTEDRIEALNAFKEKRKPNFLGR